MSQYFSGGNNPSQTSELMPWFQTGGQLVGTAIGAYFGAPGVGGMIGKDAGSDIGRLAAGDEVSKVGFDRFADVALGGPMKDMLPGQFGQQAKGFMSFLQPVAKDIFGWK